MPPTVITNILAEHQNLQAIDAGEGHVDVQIHRGEGEYETIYCALPGEIVGERAAKAAIQMLQSGIMEGIRATRAPVPELPDGIVGENSTHIATRKEIHVEVCKKATGERAFVMPRDSVAADVTRAFTVYSQGLVEGMNLANEKAK